MSLKERIYSALVVSSSEKLNTAFSPILAQTPCQPVRFVPGIRAAWQAWDARSYDFVIINYPLPDETGTRFAIDIAGKGGAVVLLLVQAELHEEIRAKVVEHGVFTLPKPLTRTQVYTALCWMTSAKERLRRMEKKTSSVEEKIEEIRLVNRAKWLLISEVKMDEPQAHRYIEKQAMNQCLSKKLIAEEIIRTYS